MTLRLAIPTGRLSVNVKAIIEKSFDCSLDSSRNYRLEFNGICGKRFKVRAIPQLLAIGKYDVGFCGIDIMEDHYAGVGFVHSRLVRDLKFNRVRIVVATPKFKEDILVNPPKRPLIIATEYPNLAGQWAFNKGLAHIILHTWGSTEGYPPEDADIIIDCSQTGETIKANGLVEIETFMESSTCVFARNDYVDNLQLKDFLEKLDKGLERVF